ncbi:cytochrome P450 family protein [Streptomyces pratensis]|uniref:cytochrome P450 family protein n=1 Tax=Streptomyces pratensis TaxID=1169025 RepID=UPI003639A286
MSIRTTATTACPIHLDASGADPHDEIARIREQGPVVQVALPGGILAWSVTSMELLKQLMTDPRVSKDAEQHWPAWMRGEIPADWPLTLWVSVRSMITAYGEDHVRLRKLVAQAFTARNVSVLRPRVEEITRVLLDRLDEVPEGTEVDLRARFAVPLPVQVVCDLLGVPEEMRGPLQETVGLTFLTSVGPAANEENIRELYGTLAELVAAGREAPGEGLITRLVAVRDEANGIGLSQQELLDTLLLIISAGYETTVNLLDHAVHRLLSNPAQLELVRSGRAAWEDVVEETLRCEPSGFHVPLRYAVEDMEIGGVRIAQGDPILVSVAGAGRDPRVHGPDAAEFDITRPTRREHITFGYGVHHCIGAPLARMEAVVALKALFGRYPDLRLARPGEDLPLLPSFITNGHRELPVRLR